MCLCKKKCSISVLVELLLANRVMVIKEVREGFYQNYIEK